MNDKASQFVEDLDKEVIEFLEGLRPEEVDRLKSLVRMPEKDWSKLMASTEVIGSIQSAWWLTKWVSIFFISAFVGANTLIQAASSLWTWLTHLGGKS